MSLFQLLVESPVFFALCMVGGVSIMIWLYALVHYLKEELAK